MILPTALPRRLHSAWNLIAIVSISFLIVGFKACKAKSVDELIAMAEDKVK